MPEETPEVLPFGVFRAPKNPAPAPAEIDLELDDEPTTPTDQETP